MKNDEFNYVKVTNERDGFSSFEFGATQDSEETSFSDNKDNIREKLMGKELESSLIDQAITTSDEYEFARFAPVESENSLENFYEKVITLIENVENSMKK